MVNIKIDIVEKMLRVIQIVSVSYIILLIVIYVLNRFISIAPIEVSDYVVSNNSEIIIYSDIENKFYIYSPELKLIRTFAISSSGGGPMLAIDRSNNLYLAQRRSVLKLDMQGHGQLVASASLASPKNWRLTREGIVKHFEGTSADESLFSTMRLRRIAEPGDVLFYEKDRSAVYSIADPFIDMKGNKYICKNWCSGIKVINSSGKMTAHLEPPLLLRAFVLPYPGAYIWIGCIAISLFLQEIIRRFLR